MAASCLSLCTTTRRGKAVDDEPIVKRPTGDLQRAQTKIMELQLEVNQLKSEIANAKRKKDMYRFSRAIRKTLMSATTTVWSIIKDVSTGSGLTATAFVVLTGAVTGAVFAIPLENAGKIVRPVEEKKEVDEDMTKAMEAVKSAAKQEVKAAREQAAAAQQATNKQIEQRLTFMQVVTSRRSGMMLLKASFAHWRRDWDLAAREAAARAWEEEALETVIYFREEAEKQMIFVRAESDERVAEAEARAQAARKAWVVAKTKVMGGLQAEAVDEPAAASVSAQNMPLISTRVVSWAKPEAQAVHDAKEGMAFPCSQLPGPPPSPPPRKGRGKANATVKAEANMNASPQGKEAPISVLLGKADDANEKPSAAAAAAAERFAQKLKQRLESCRVLTDESTSPSLTDAPQSSWFHRPHRTSSPGRVSMRRSSPRKVKKVPASWGDAI